MQPIETSDLRFELMVLERAVALQHLGTAKLMPNVTETSLEQTLVALSALRDGLTESPFTVMFDHVLELLPVLDRKSPDLVETYALSSAWHDLVAVARSQFGTCAYLQAGERVHTFVPKTKALQADMIEAENCRRLNRHTACVFHLSRVCESLLRMLAKKAAVNVGPEDNWHVLAGRLGNHANNMPGTTTKEKESRKLLSSVTLALSSVRLAHRNDVMHPGRLSTADEAEQMFPQVVLAVQAGEQFLGKRG